VAWPPTDPRLVWRDLPNYDLNFLRSRVTQSWLPIASNRLGTVHVFSRPGRFLYLSRDETHPRAELQRTAPCNPLTVAFPERPPDLWLQFGTSPSHAVEASEMLFGGFEIKPCPVLGYWIGRGSFYAVAPQRTQLTVGSALVDPVEGARQSLPLFGPTVVLENDADGVAAAWYAQRWWRYSGSELDVDQALQTACGSVRPAFVCWVWVRAFLARGHEGGPAPSNP